MIILPVLCTCRGCGTSSIVEADADGINAWQEGMLIQDALPELTASQREALVSGTCAPCWDRISLAMEEDE